MPARFKNLIDLHFLKDDDFRIQFTNHFNTQSHLFFFRFIPENTQFYYAYDVAIDAAKKLAEYLNSKRPVSIITPEIRAQANAIASESLQEDEGLLAIAIAAPSLKLAVVQFRDVIELAPEVSNNHTLLKAYWRELGIAWNHTEGAEFWGPPFLDCGALKWRWLWPYSVNFQANGIKYGFFPVYSISCRLNVFIMP